MGRLIEPIQDFIYLSPLIPLSLSKERGKDIKKRGFAPLRLPFGQASRM